VDVQPNHPGSSPKGYRFGFLLLQNNILGSSFTVFLFKKSHVHLQNINNMKEEDGGKH
jgi:hypothetical protein